MKSAEARITWRPREEGGRLIPPPGPTYSTVARFIHQGGDWREHAWSLVLHYIEQPDAARSHRVAVSYLSPAGPSEWLKSGNRFELVEGNKVVANGEVIANAEQRTEKISGDLTFVTNEPGNNLRDRFNTLLTNDTRFSIAWSDIFTSAAFTKFTRHSKTSRRFEFSSDYKLTARLMSYGSRRERDGELNLVARLNETEGLTGCAE